MNRGCGEYGGTVWGVAEKGSRRVVGQHGRAEAGKGCKQSLAVQHILLFPIVPWQVQRPLPTMYCCEDTAKGC